MFLSVNQHKCDICIGGISITKKRKKYVDFSEPYYYTSQSVVVPAGNTEFDEAKTAEDVEKILREKGSGTIVGVENLTTAQNYCEGSNGYNGFGMSVKGYRDIETAIGALISGDCQYVVGDYATAKWFADKANEEAK